MNCGDRQEGNRKENAAPEPVKQEENVSIRIKWGLRYIAMPSRKSVPFTITSRPSGLPTAGCRLRPLLNTHEDAGFHDSARPSSFSWPCLTPIELSFYAHTTSTFGHSPTLVLPLSQFNIHNLQQNQISVQVLAQTLSSCMRDGITLEEVQSFPL